jgi:hypothetical protein
MSHDHGSQLHHAEGGVDCIMQKKPSHRIILGSQLHHAEGGVDCIMQKKPAIGSFLVANCIMREVGRVASCEPP